MAQTFEQQKAAVLAQCRDLLRLQRKALSTEDTYLHWIGSYIEWLQKHGRDKPNSRERMEAYLTAQANRGVSASTQNQAFNALLYLYEQVRREKIGDIRALRAKRPQQHRTALSKPDTLALLDRVPDVAGYPTKLIARLLYGCGLRVSEPLNLRIKDVEVHASRLIIRGAKGGKDRVIRVPCAEMAQVVAQIQRAVKLAACALGLEGLATPHVLRHCYATHTLDAGANVRDVQSALGHSHLNTTMGYTHADGERVRSPLETSTPIAH